MLKREIGKWDLILLILNATIGAGILGLPSAIYRIVGVYSILAILGCGILVVIIGLTFSRVATRFDATGGPYLYTLAAFGKTPAFLMGWTMLTSRVFTFAALMNLLLSYFDAAKLSPWTRPIFIIGFTGVIAAVNYLGIRKSTVFNNFLSGFKIASLLGFILAGIFFLREPNFRLSGSLPSVEQFSSAALLLIFSFTGFEAALVATGEVKKPKKAIGFALICSLLTVATIYSFV
ncbi:MAG TPA: APC family permease, partial [Cyclobacteriaceae bacterium]|nr:APC family permease [Cyclobacteriaceae bacterium]